MNRKHDPKIAFTDEELAEAEIHWIQGGYAVDIDYTSYRLKYGGTHWETAHNVISPDSVKGKQLHKILNTWSRENRKHKEATKIWGLQDNGSNSKLRHSI